ncbi:MAG: glycosyltransferase family 4 protein [Flexilinea sp.]
MKIYIDITNMLNQKFVTGIQRVVREITTRLIQKAASRNQEIILLFYNELSNEYIIIDNDNYLSFLDGSMIDRNGCFTTRSISIFDFKSDTFFFDLDCVWTNRLRRSFLLPVLKNHNVWVISYLYDLIPITHPQFMDATAVLYFSNHLAAHLKYADMFAASAQSTLMELNSIQDRLGINHKKSIAVHLGSDFSKKEYLSTEKVDPIAERIQSKGPYILCVATIEVRKNHQIILDAFDQKLQKFGVQLVFVGRRGWLVEDLLNRIDKHPQKNKSFYFLEGMNDATIDYLYQHAFLSVSASTIEGFGLPLIESIMRGTPVLAADIPVFREVGGEYCDYFDPADADDLAEKVKYFLNNPAVYEEKKRLLESYKPMTWDESEELLSQQLFVEERPDIIHQHLKQIVIISERVEVLLDTIGFIENFMPFISEIVICSSQEKGNEVIREYRGRCKIIILYDRVNGEEKISTIGISEKGNKKYLFLSDERIDEEFILSIDNYRPLMPLSDETFVHDGRYQAYYCGDFFASESLSDVSFFTDLQTKTTAFLNQYDYPSLNYDSYMPQVINKSWFLKMISDHVEIINDGLCIWSTYFDYSVHNHPQDFNVVPYQTLNWEFGPADFESSVRPKKYIFENFNKALYEEGQPFSRFSQSWYDGSLAENFEKIQIYDQIRHQSESRRIAEKVYSQIYWRRYRELPSFVMEYFRDKLQFFIPDEYMIVNEACIDIDLHIIWRDIPDAEPAFTVEWYLSSMDDVPTTENSKIKVLKNQDVVFLSIHAQIIDYEVLLHLKGSIGKNAKVFSKTIRIQAIYI